MVTGNYDGSSFEVDFGAEYGAERLHWVDMLDEDEEWETEDASDRDPSDENAAEPEAAPVLSRRQAMQLKQQERAQEEAHRRLRAQVDVGNVRGERLKKLKMGV